MPSTRSHALYPADSEVLSLQVDGERVHACAGETVLSALFATGQRAITQSDRGLVTGGYCGMGVCYSCVVIIDGAKRRACQSPVREGMTVTTATSFHSVIEGAAARNARVEARRA